MSGEEAGSRERESDGDI